jgi:eukaryotic-like serine/threonine-protein kinase
VSLKFDSLEEEVRFLRGLVSVQRMADEVLEDSLARNLGLHAALDVFLTQCMRMIHSHGAFVTLRGTQETVLTRLVGAEYIDVRKYGHYDGAVVINEKHTLFVAPLELGDINFGGLGFLLPGKFEGGGKQVLALVEAIAEMLDSAVLAFLALTDGSGPLARLDELSERSAFRPRGRIGKYELVTPLGSGGMAQVMVARTIGPMGVSRLVALKRILPHLAKEESMVEQFLDEAKLGLKLSHPNLVTFFDFGQAAGGNYFMAMELLRGVDFDHLIYAPPGKLAPNVASAVLLQALDGLQAAHELKGQDGNSLGLVHRDLSPHNLMVGFDGRVKVLDFGVAKVRNARTVTLPGIVKGKPLYMSPEQATAERVDRRSDVFAMGLILYESVAGHRAFDKGNDTLTMMSIVNEPLPRPEGMDPVCWELISKAISKRPEDRFRTATEFAATLRERIRPVTDADLGRMVTQRFPRQLEEYQKWERLAQEWSDPTLPAVARPKDLDEEPPPEGT